VKQDVNELVTTALDVLGLLVVAAGVFFACRPLLAAAALVPAGVTVLGGSAVWAWLQRRPRKDGEP
jgi:hypothetical protein